jgi:Zn-dependent M28 family amino/carboxypeptidase
MPQLAFYQANDIFKTGLILSDTDYRQFVDYGRISGIDMAFYENSYVYHTMLDLESTITPGSIQVSTFAITFYVVPYSVT